MLPSDEPLSVIPVDAEEAALPGPPPPRFPSEPVSRQFIQLLVASELMSAQEAAQAVAAVPADQRQDLSRLAKALAQQGKLTWFQASHLAKGHAGGLVLGNYIILDMLGTGGMGVVYKALHRRMQRVVALKVLPPDFSKNRDAVLRFQREVQAAARASHPHVVAAHDADEYKGVHFLVMEYIEGSDLGRRIRKQGPLTVDQARDCIVQAARGLQHAHAVGLIHRDIKPSNLMLDARGVVKISDLGLARMAAGRQQGDGLTASGGIMGTMDFMAPEQAISPKSVDSRADIYSLGCTLYTLLTGRPMYEGETQLAILVAHRDQPIPRLPATAADLQSIFERMVAKRPDDRYPSMAEVIADLEKPRGSTVRPAVTAAVPVAILIPETAAMPAGFAPLTPPPLSNDEIIDASLASLPGMPVPVADHYTDSPLGQTERDLFAKPAAVKSRQADRTCAMPNPPSRPGPASVLSRPSKKMICFFVACLSCVAAAGLLLSLVGRSEPTPSPSSVSDGRTRYDKLISDLQIEQDQLTKAGKLDEALAVRERLRKYRGEVNLLVNGSFEEGPPGLLGFVTLNAGSTAIRGWTVTHGQIDLKATYWQHFDGQRSIDLHGDIRGGLRQSFTTVKGMKYRVSLAMTGHPVVPQRMMRLRIVVNENHVEFFATGHSHGDMHWETKTWEFVANADESTLELLSLNEANDPFGPAVDKVEVVMIRP